MGRSLFWLIGISCALLVPSNAQLNLDVPLTETLLIAQVETILTIASKSLSELQTTLLEPIDKYTENLVKNLTTNPALKTAFDMLGIKAKEAKAPPLEFNCNDPTLFKSATKPTSAHKVRIGDINLVALMGDSVSAGLGTVLNDVISATTLQGRGYCSKVGGTGTVAAGNTTVPNIMRDLFQNSNLKGYSIGDGHCSQQNVGCSRLNVANIYAFHPDYILQAIELVRRIRFDTQYKIDDWKMIHIFYGVNDLCLLCQKLHFGNEVMLGLDMRLALTIIKHFLKNVIVYLHVPYDLTKLHDLSQNIACDVVQRAICPCVANPALGLGATVKSNQLLIADTLHKIAIDPAFNDREDFTISEIKHLTNTEPPRDASGNLQPEILGGNCLHPSRAAHYIHAGHTINEMFTAPDQRPLSADYTVNVNTPRTIKCPTADNPYLRTYKN